MQFFIDDLRINVQSMVSENTFSFLFKPNMFTTQNINLPKILDDDYVYEILKLIKDKN